MRFQWSEKNNRFFYGLKFCDQFIWFAYVKKKCGEWETAIWKDGIEFERKYFDSLIEAKKFAERETPTISKEIINKLKDDYEIDFMIGDILDNNE